MARSRLQWRHVMESAAPSGGNIRTFPGIRQRASNCGTKRISATFWGNESPNPAAYAAMVKAAYTSIKQADPGMTVLVGGLASAGGYDDVTCSGQKGAGHDQTAWNELNYLQALYADGIHGYFDAVAWHVLQLLARRKRH